MVLFLYFLLFKTCKYSIFIIAQFLKRYIESRVYEASLKSKYYGDFFKFYLEIFLFLEQK